jgi:hypothetical protein
MALPSAALFAALEAAVGTNGEVQSVLLGLSTRPIASTQAAGFTQKDEEHLTSGSGRRAAPNIVADGKHSLVPPAA